MIQKCHFIGIGGIGMSGLARILAGQNCAVTGSDVNSNYVTEGLVKRGIKVYLGHQKQNVEPDTTVVYSTDIKQDNPEFLAAMEFKCPILHRSDLLASLMLNSKSLAVAGTHGKTTTSALLASVLIGAGWDPSFAIGGVLPQLETNAGYGKGEFFVAEADESDGTFLKYTPYGAIVTNIDTDHMEYFKTEANLLTSFQTFIGAVQNRDLLFLCGDDPRLSQFTSLGISYGFSDSCDLKITKYRQQGWKSLFDLSFKGNLYEGIELNLVGKHNIANATAVFGLCLALGVSEGAIRKGLTNFGGVMRRAEKKAEVQGVLFLDDYAHHPTEIATTLKGIRQAVEERKLIVVFQPHRFTRTRDCLGTFKRVFLEADEVIITDIYAAGEKPIEGISHENILEEVRHGWQVPSRYIKRTEIATVLAASLKPHSVVVSMGAGDITKLSSEITQILHKHPLEKLRIGLVCGGRSGEHEVSIRSCRFVASSLDRNYYDVSLFGITKNGEWRLGPDLLKHTVIPPSSDREDGEIRPEVMREIAACDVMFPVLHGPFGEDGTIQGFFEVLNKPYVGCDYRAAALAMDKALTKQLAETQGILTSPYQVATQVEWRTHPEKVLDKITQTLIFPLFVKPVHLGSSLGIRKVKFSEELASALDYAFSFDTKIIIENGVEGREIEFAVFGNEFVHVFPPGEICSGGQVYDYEFKYGANSAETVTQAELPREAIERGMELAKQAYLAIGCQGLARVDFFYDRQGRFLLNEINPIPGCTQISLYPKICAANGFGGSELMHRLIVLSLHKKRQYQRCERV